jgi:hypothetical protein
MVGPKSDGEIMGGEAVDPSLLPPESPKERKIKLAKAKEEAEKNWERSQQGKKPIGSTTEAANCSHPWSVPCSVPGRPEAWSCCGACGAALGPRAQATGWGPTRPGR